MQDSIDKLKKLLNALNLRWNGKQPKGARVRVKKSKQLVAEMVLEDRR